MAATLREHNPDVSLTVLLLDCEPEELDSPPPGALVLGAASLVGERYGLLAAANPPGALSMAVLPELMRVVLASGAGSAIYIGAGQRVLGPLVELEQLLDDHEVVLVARPGWRAGRSRCAGDAGKRRVQQAGARAGCGHERAGPARRLAAVLPGRGRRRLGSGSLRGWTLLRPGSRASACCIIRDMALDPFSLAGVPTEWADRAEGRRILEVAGAPARVLDFSQLDPDEPGRALLDRGGCGSARRRRWWSWSTAKPRIC